MRMRIVGAAALAILAITGGVAVAREDQPSANDTASITKTTVAAAGSKAKAANPGKKPRPSKTPTTSPTPSPTPTQSASPTPPPGWADVKIPLPGYGFPYHFGDILVDDARQRIYLTGGPSTNDLVVTDLDGNIVHRVSDIPGAAGMALSPDGSKLYVTASDEWWITIVDTTTYETDGLFAGKTDGSDTCPRDVAFAAGQLWFSWGCPDTADGYIGRIDPQTREYDLSVARVDSEMTSAPLLATVPGQPDVLIAGETGSNPAELFRFQVTSTELVQQAWRRTDGGSVRQLAVTPDGSQVIVPSGSPYYHPALSTTDLTEVHRYPTVAYPNAVAIRDDGLVVAGTNSSYDDDVWVFEPGGSTPIATFDFGHLPNDETWAHTLVDGGLAVDGNRIYAVTEQSSEPDMVTLRIRTLD
jgi:DNA-binding beta-propeller fold protein YncE